jgi:heme-degrading monooxygenase HmoA
MRRSVYGPVLGLLLSGGVASAQNAMPTAQPSVLTIAREELKVGQGPEHEVTESGWPVAFAKARTPATYIAITSMTGANEVWFISPYASWKAVGDEMKFEDGNAELAAELKRLVKADAVHLTGARTWHLIARTDLSAGSFPSVAKTRFYEMTWFRVRPGHQQEFEAVAKKFGAAYRKAAPQSGYRAYQVVAGMVGPTYLVVQSFESLAELDKGPATDAAVMAALGAEDGRAIEKFEAEGLVSSETQRFAMNGPMSYVDQATIDSDPAFWRPKKAAAKKVVP